MSALIKYFYPYLKRKFPAKLFVMKLNEAYKDGW